MSAISQLTVVVNCVLGLLTLPLHAPAASLLKASSDAQPKFENLKACLLDAGILQDQIIARDVAEADDPSSQLYEDINFQWNTIYGDIRTLAYVLAQSSTDVSSAVYCCTRVGVRIVARSGGHSYLKYGHGDADTLIVDLQYMNHVQVDSASMTAVVGAGARGGKVQHDLWAAGGFLFPHGGCPIIGITGYTLGGGYGDYGRIHGLAADNLLEATVVDATGVVSIVNSSTDPDMLWALRGGGGGSFGIVTELKVKIHPSPTHIIWANVAFDFEQFPHFYKAYQAFITGDPPKHLGTLLSMNSATVIGMRLFSIGGTVAELQRILITQFPAPSSVTTIDQFTYPEFLLFRAQPYSDEPLTDPAQLTNLTRPIKVEWKRAKSIIVDRVLETDQEIADLHDLLRDYLQWSRLFIEHYGGAINDLGPSDTAFVHRGNVLYQCQLLVLAEEGQEGDPQAVEAMERFFDKTKLLLGHTQSYQNYLDENLPDWLQRYYGTNLERLMRVKKSVDPNNVFYNPKSIPVSIES